ncbi:hypothetical protein TIFTF001_053243 [Ficus carica]|uniref:Uncharacterized protein n=1 Tax=Ficus carica TaxID=3494 RepID=A0AA88EPI4_FICCA|nr:hypothetical protein TIFTF001_053243 [Ficus carica]
MASHNPNLSSMEIFEKIRLLETRIFQILGISVVLGIIVGVACLAELGYTLRELSKTKEIYARYTDVEEVAGAEVAAEAGTLPELRMLPELRPLPKSWPL